MYETLFNRNAELPLLKPEETVAPEKLDTPVAVGFVDLVPDEASL